MTELEVIEKVRNHIDQLVLMMAQRSQELGLIANSLRRGGTLKGAELIDEIKDNVLLFNCEQSKARNNVDGT